jgi:hypothetical protein
MATLTFTFDTGNVPTSEIVDALCATYNYQDTIDGQPNPETKAQFARKMVARMIGDVVRGYRLRLAREAAEVGVADVDLV